MLITHGIETIAQDPETFGVVELEGYKAYHLKLSKKKVAYKNVRVKNPPHMIIFKVEGDTLYVIRVLHDVMQISDHL